MAPLPGLTERHQIVYTSVADFDPAKDAINLSKHGILLALGRNGYSGDRASRFDYGDPRYRAYGSIDGVAYCLVFTIRNERYRPISLRRAHSKEMRRHVPEN